MPLCRCPIDPLSHMAALSRYLRYPRTCRWLYIDMVMHSNCFATFRHLNLVVCSVVLKDIMKNSILCWSNYNSSGLFQNCLWGWDQPSPRNSGFLLYFSTRDGPLVWQMNHFISQVIIAWINVELLITLCISYINIHIYSYTLLQSMYLSKCLENMMTAQLPHER